MGLIASNAFIPLALGVIKVHVYGTRREDITRTGAMSVTLHPNAGHMAVQCSSSVRWQ